VLAPVSDEAIEYIVASWMMGNEGLSSVFMGPNDCPNPCVHAGWRWRGHQLNYSQFHAAIGRPAGSPRRLVVGGGGGASAAGAAAGAGAGAEEGAGADHPARAATASQAEGGGEEKEEEEGEGGAEEGSSMMSCSGVWWRLYSKSIVFVNPQPVPGLPCVAKLPQVDGRRRGVWRHLDGTAVPSGVSSVSIAPASAVVLLDAGDSEGSPREGDIHEQEGV
jgi:hypothetical protein